ncbi:acyltransferase [Gallaecimonas kandeliae]|uniref:MBOAT family O-acyltransferase n=1 Tax=Gallaecimonas kandeliae TaxID=3029055 RepID=UPI0026496DFA|nr:MBOAT family O-acyltransferase [Gallaecimonas kandeliae]WKE64250.1 acyltransferase [Gallaecimonas kandeliae]
MPDTLSLSDYVKRRNGLPLGAPGSMRNMLRRSLGAASFPAFWHYWNPIWGYYLSRHVMKPLGKWLPMWSAILLTFAVSGALHDLAVTLVKWRLTCFFTPWFVLMGAGVLAAKQFNLTYGGRPWALRMACNLAFVALSLALTLGFEAAYAG